jgi:hypothetical protein
MKRKFHLPTILPAIALVTLFNLVTPAVQAQTLHIDSEGYVTDANFRQQIKDKGFQLFGRFDTVSRKPAIQWAPAFKDNKSVHVNSKWLIRQEMEMTPVYPSESRGYISSDVAIDAPVTQPEEQYEQVVENQKIGTRDKNTHKSGLPAIYDGLTWTTHNHIVYIKSNGKTGVALASGKVLVQPAYDGGIDRIAGHGKNADVYVVSNNRKMGLLDANFKEIVVPDYDYINYCMMCDLSQQLLMVRSGKKQGIINRQGKVVVQPIYDGIMPGGNGASLIAKNDKKYGLIDTTGKVVLDINYSSIETSIAFPAMFVIKNNALKGLADRNGKMIIEPTYLDILPFSNGLAIVEGQYVYGVINKQGKVIIPVTYYHIAPSGNDFLVQQGGKYGLMDADGNTVFPASYDQLNKAGKLFFFKTGASYGLADRKGKVIRTFDFENLEYDSGYLIFKKDGKTGVANLMGKVLIPAQYDQFFGQRGSTLRTGIFSARRDGRSCMLDIYGNEVFK